MEFEKLQGVRALHEFFFFFMSEFFCLHWLGSTPLGRYRHEVKASPLCYLSMTGLVKVKLSTPAEVAPVTPYLSLFFTLLPTLPLPAHCWHYLPFVR